MAEKELERNLIRSLQLLGADVDEFSQRRASKCRCGAKLYAGTQQTLGIPDLRAVFTEQGITVWLEVKWKKNKPTPHQRAWMRRECRLGTLAVPVWDLVDLMYVLSELGILNEPVPPDVSNMTLEYVGYWKEWSRA